MRSASRALAFQSAGSSRPSSSTRPPPPDVPPSRRPLILDDDRDIDPRHRARVGHESTVGAQNRHLLQRGRNGRRHLDHPRIEIAGKGVDLAQGLDLHRERHGPRSDRHRCRDVGVGALRRIGQRAAAISHRKPCRFGGAQKRGFADLGRMGISRDLAAHRAQSETLGGVVARGLDATIVEHQHFGAAALEKQLSVIRPRERIAQLRQRVLLVQHSLEGTEGGIGHGAFLSEFCSRGRRRLCKSVRLPQATFFIYTQEYGFKQRQHNGVCRIRSCNPLSSPARDR